jgi:hypothetical protein
MSDKQRFSCLLRPNERAKLKRYSQILDRSEGATLRYLINHADRILPAEPSTAQPQQAQGVQHVTG